MAKLSEVEKAIKEKIPVSIAQENLKAEMQKLKEKQEQDKEYKREMNKLNIEVL